MADLDKESLMNMIGSILGEDKKAQASSVIDSITQNMESSDVKNEPNESKNATANSGELIDTVAIMSKVTNVMGKLNSTKNNKEYVLLSAIKPYMRDGRQGKIDSCLKVLQVVNVINGLKK